MNIYDVIKYFNLQSFSTYNGNGGMNNEIVISGKFRKKYFLVFLFLTGCFVLFDIMNMVLFPLIIDFFAYFLVFIEHIILFIRLEKKVKIDFYHRQLPSNLKPAHVRMLMNDGLIDEISIATTLMDLIDKGYLKIEAHENDMDFFKYSDDIILTKTDKNTDDLLKYEVFLIDWFINICGDGRKVTKKELHDRLNDMSSLTSNERYNNFKAYVIISYPFYKFYKRHCLKIHKFKSYLAVCLILFTCVIAPFLSFNSAISIAALPIIGFGILFFNNPIFTLNSSGFTEKNNWTSLKKFFTDFTKINEKRADMIVLWSYYLTYSVALDENVIAKDEIVNFFGTNIHVGNDAYSSSDSNSENDIRISLSDATIKMIEQVIEEEKVKYNYKSIFNK